MTIHGAHRVRTRDTLQIGSDVTHRFRALADIAARTVDLEAFRTPHEAF